MVLYLNKTGYCNIIFPQRYDLETKTWDIITTTGDVRTIFIFLVLILLQEN